MAFTPKEIIVGATVPLANGSSVTLSFAGHIEKEQDCDDAMLIFSRKLLKYTNSASDEDRLTVRQVVSSITSTPLDKVPDVGTPDQAPPATVTLNQISPLPERMPAPTTAKTPAATASKTPTTAEQAAAAVAACIKPAAPQPTPSAPPTPEASTVATAKSAPPVPTTAPDGEVCGICGAPVAKAQANLSQIFMGKTLCKPCMDKRLGAS